MFELDRFVWDLRASLGDRSRRALKEIVEHGISDVVSLLKVLGESTGPGVQVLHRAADLTVLNVTWAPNQITLPHDHRMTAVIGLYAGREDNLFWRRAAAPHRFAIEAAGDFLGTQRSMWNPLTLAEEPYDVAAILKGAMPVTTLRADDAPGFVQVDLG